MTTAIAPPERASRTARKIPFFHAEPVPRWLAGVLVLYAVAVLLNQLQYVATGLTDDGTTDLLQAVTSILSYGAVGMIAWRSTWASAASISSLLSSTIADYYPTAIVAACVLTIAVAATATRRFIVAHFVVHLLWAATAATLREPFDDSLLWSMVNALLISGLVGGAVRYFREQRRRDAERVRNLEILNERLREDERQALARDLHDVVAHELTLITMQTMSRRRSENVEELHQVLETVEDAARSALHELRVLLKLLRNENEGEHPRDVTGAGLAIGSLEHVVTSLAASLQDLGFEPDVVISERIEATPTTVRGTAARILQEAVTNIIKYAPPGSACRLELTADEHELRLLVTNPMPRGPRDTGGRSSELSSGLGLRGITERVSLLDGHAESGPRDGQWVLDVRLPVSHREAV